MELLFEGLGDSVKLDPDGVMYPDVMLWTKNCYVTMYHKAVPPLLPGK